MSIRIRWSSLYRETRFSFGLFGTSQLHENAGEIHSGSHQIRPEPKRGLEMLYSPGKLRLLPEQVVLSVDAPGTIVVRVRYSGRWALVDGEGCVHATPDGWTAVEADHTGQLRLDLRMVGGDPC